MNIHAISDAAHALVTASAVVAPPQHRLAATTNTHAARDLRLTVGVLSFISRMHGLSPTDKQFSIETTAILVYEGHVTDAMVVAAAALANLRLVASPLVTVEEIKEMFGTSVAELVAECGKMSYGRLVNDASALALASRNCRQVMLALHIQTLRSVISFPDQVASLQEYKDFCGRVFTACNGVNSVLDILAARLLS
jgi:hypothetical protein